MREEKTVLVGMEEIRAAAKRIAGIAVRTPLVKVDAHERRAETSVEVWIGFFAR